MSGFDSRGGASLHATMAATKQNHCLKAEIREYNDRLDCELKRRAGITVKVYKIIKAVVQLVGALAGVMAMHQGADPMTAFALIAFIIGGPEAFEFVLTNQE